MATKTLSSVVGNQATRQLELPNLDGTIHPAGTRGVIGKSIFSGTWGFMPLANKGILKTYMNSSMTQYWSPGMSSQIDDNSPKGGSCAAFIAPNGDCIVAAYLHPEQWNSTSASSRDLRVYAFDADTGDLKHTFIPSTASNLNYNGGNELNESDMQIWNPATDFYVAQVKLRSTTGRVQLHGFNYNTSTQTLSVGSITTLFVMANGTPLTTPKFHYSMNNAGTELAVLYPDNLEACEWKTITISGSAGAYTLGTLTLRDNISMDGSGIQKFKAGGQSHVHRLSNDDVIMFGHTKTGATTAVHYDTTGDDFIAIMDSQVIDITQGYYLMDEVVSGLASKKFYYHQCLHSWEIATDTYILLTKNSSAGIVTQGPEGFWSDDDGFNHVRAIKIVVDPADNSITQTDLGQFSSSFFRGCCFQNNNAEQHRDTSSVYDLYMDVSAKAIFIFTKTYSTRLQFNSDWTATDEDNSDIVFAPIAPKQIHDAQQIINTNVYATTALEDLVMYDNRWHSEHHYAYDSINKKMWMPMYLSFDIVSSKYPGVPAMVVYDMEQCSGTALQVIVGSADANNVQCIADCDVFDNNGVPIGSMIGDTFAITDSQILSRKPEGHILDVLCGDMTTDGSQEDWLYMIPDGRILIGGSALRINKGKMTHKYILSNNIWTDDNGMVFNAAGMDSLQDPVYEGPMFQWDNLTTDMWVWLESNVGSTDYGNLMVVSEGWWIYGTQGHIQTDASGGGRKYGFQIRPTSRVEINGRFGGSAPQIFVVKFSDTNKKRTLF